MEREHLALWQASILAAAQGSTVEVRTLAEAQADFDEWLTSAPVARDRGRDATLRVFSGRAA